MRLDHRRRWASLSVEVDAEPVAEARVIPREAMRDRFAGILIGTAVGDALGLPREGLSNRRAARMFGTASLRHSFVFGRGMCSDDTEHACMVAQAWLAARGDVERFTRSLAWRLRWWFLGMPAGVGLATLRACLRLWLGFSPQRSGVFSAGNGPAMRSAVLAACAVRQPQRLAELVRASARLTHIDPRAEEGALAVALAAERSLRHGPTLDALAALDEIRERTTGEELRSALAAVKRLACDEADVAVLCRELGCSGGVSGYVNQTVPVALFCWCRWHTDFRSAIEAVIGLGGDTDTTAAITGALVGASVGAERIPAEWVSGMADWPRSVSWLRRLAETLATAATGAEESDTIRPLRLFWPGLIPRNLLFLTIVLIHGLRRLLPPY